MKEKRELKRPLQDLVHDGTNMDIKMRELYDIFKRIRYDIDNLVLQYMSKERKNDGPDV